MVFGFGGDVDVGFGFGGDVDVEFGFSGNVDVGLDTPPKVWVWRRCRCGIRHAL